MPRVKGLAFRSVLRAVADLDGTDSVDRVYERLEPALADRLRLVLASSWYPIGDYVALWRGVQLATGNRSDHPRLVGRRCVEQDLKLVHRLAFSALSVTTVIGISARLFGTYYDTGTCRSVRVADRTMRVTCEGCEGFSAHMWMELRGAMECFVKQSSKRPATSLPISGGRDGDLGCVVDVSWA